MSKHSSKYNVCIVQEQAGDKAFVHKEDLLPQKKPKQTVDLSDCICIYGNATNG